MTDTDAVQTAEPELADPPPVRTIDDYTVTVSRLFGGFGADAAFGPPMLNPDAADPTVQIIIPAALSAKLGEPDQITVRIT